jgi:hypothetical protein
MPAMGIPLSVEAIQPAGTPSRWAIVGVISDGVLLFGPVLGWLTRTYGATDHLGRWLPEHVPARDLQVLIWANDQELTQQVLAGNLNHRSEHISYPWEDSIVVEAIE